MKYNHMLFIVKSLISIQGAKQGLAIRELRTVFGKL